MGHERRQGGWERVADVNAGADAERRIMARLRGLAQESTPEEARSRLEARDAPASARGGAGTIARLERFRARAEANGMSCEIVHNRGEAVSAVGDYIGQRQSQRRLVAGHDARLAALPWRDAGLLPRFGVAGSADAVTVSYAHQGIAESGSLVLRISRDNPGLNNLLSEVQVILVDSGSLVESLDDIWNEGFAAARPRGVMLVSGPSSTADIGMQLVLGAHGPRAVHVVVVAPRSDQYDAAEDTAASV